MTAAIPGGALIDGSGSTVAAATSQQVFAANTGRQYLLIQNISASTCWINFGIPAVEAQPSIRLNAGTLIEFSAGGTGVVPTASVHLIGVGIAQPFTAKEA